jgi:hypothetical protein
VPRVPAGTKRQIVILEKIQNVAPVFSAGGNAVRLDDTIIQGCYHIVQTEKFDLHTKGAIGKVLEHGVLLFKPYKQVIVYYIRQVLSFLLYRTNKNQRPNRSGFPEPQLHTKRIDGNG